MARRLLVIGLRGGLGGEMIWTWVGFLHCEWRRKGKCSGLYTNCTLDSSAVLVGMFI
jgi:hypothetical protein